MSHTYTQHQIEYRLNNIYYLLLNQSADTFIQLKSSRGYRAACLSLQGDCQHGQSFHRLSSGSHIKAKGGNLFWNDFLGYFLKLSLNPTSNYGMKCSDECMKCKRICGSRRPVISPSIISFGFHLSPYLPGYLSIPWPLIAHEEILLPGYAELKLASKSSVLGEILKGRLRLFIWLDTFEI